MLLALLVLYGTEHSGSLVHVRFSMVHVDYDGNLMGFSAASNTEIPLVCTRGAALLTCGRVIAKPQDDLLCNRREVKGIQTTPSLASIEGRSRLHSANQLFATHPATG